MENKIIDAARNVFIERGYVETSMSEIANRVGINRPTLHYYFRTKDRLFQAVFSSIISSIVPKVFETLRQKEKSITERIEVIIDAYYELFIDNPLLPLFIMKELNRDADLLINTVKQLNVMDTARNAFNSIQEEMNDGKLNIVPLQFIFYNFYSLLIFPFLTQEISTKVFGNDKEQFKAMLSEWKRNIIIQMQNLLEIK